MDNIGLMSEIVSFIQGSKKNYDSSTMQGGVYFSKDSKEILLNGESYGNAVPADEEDLTFLDNEFITDILENYSTIFISCDNFIEKGNIVKGYLSSSFSKIFRSAFEQKGTTSQRPSLTTADEGFEYYDTTLNKQIIWNGAEWTNIDGTSLDTPINEWTTIE